VAIDRLNIFLSNHQAFCVLRGEVDGSIPF
jgi:hypothetical protein